MSETPQFESLPFVPFLLSKVLALIGVRDKKKRKIEKEPREWSWKPVLKRYPQRVKGKRDLEKDDIEKRQLVTGDKSNIAISLNGIAIPYDIVQFILSFFFKNCNLLNGLGLVNTVWYLNVLSSWKKVLVTGKTHKSIPILVLKSISSIEIDGIFQSNEMERLLNNLTPHKIRKIYLHNEFREYYFKGESKTRERFTNRRGVLRGFMLELDNVFGKEGIKFILEVPNYVHSRFLKEYSYFAERCNELIVTPVEGLFTQAGDNGKLPNIFNQLKEVQTIKFYWMSTSHSLNLNLLKYDSLIRFEKLKNLIFVVDGYGISNAWFEGWLHTYIGKEKEKEMRAKQWLFSFVFSSFQSTGYYYGFLKEIDKHRVFDKVSIEIKNYTTYGVLKNVSKGMKNYKAVGWNIDWNRKATYFYLEIIK